MVVISVEVLCLNYSVSLDPHPNPLPEMEREYRSVIVGCRLGKHFQIGTRIFFILTHFLTVFFGLDKIGLCQCHLFLAVLVPLRG